MIPIFLTFFFPSFFFLFPAWYGLGQTYEILKMYNYAIYYYRKAVQLRPYDSRMWLAVGKCFAEKLNKLDYAISSYKRAYRHQDHEGIAAYQLGMSIYFFFSMQSANIMMHALVI